MEFIGGVLSKELEQLKQTESGWRQEIHRLPKGSIQQKIIKGIPYLYLVYRSQSRLNYRYLGRMDSAGLEELKKRIDLRRTRKKQLREVKKKIKNLQQIIRVYAPTYE